jgi:very-short-patch-repair endonuclease
VPEPQVWVLDSTGRRAYRIDLAYRERRVGLEYDGRSHLTLARLNADRSRMNWLGARGWAMRYFTARDVYRTPALVVAEVRAVLR